MYSKIFKTGRNRVLAVILAAAVVLTLIAVGIGSTLAAKTEITAQFTDPNPAVSVAKVEVGATVTRPVAGAYSWVNSDSTILQLTAPLGTNTATSRGLKAGTAILSVGTNDGYVQGLKYEVTNSANITKYILADGGEGIIGKVGGTLLVPIRTFVTPTQGGEPVENAAAKNTITWSTYRANDPVASVNASTGLITGLSNGATIVIGSFVDKWGVPQDVHFLVSVGVSINDSRIGELLDLIKEAQTVIALNPNPYTDASIDNLEDALADAIAALTGSEQQIIQEIGDLQDALDALVTKPTTPPGIITDGNGNYYKPVGDPEKVYEVVNQDGTSKTDPPSYVYDADGDPSNGITGPAYKEGGNYYIQDPENIFKKVDHDGSIIETPAIWGGPDGALGGGDDKPAYKFGGDYYLDLGQNIFQKITPPKTLGPLVGGGPDENPATAPVTPIIKVGDKYYVGPLGPDGDGNEYYYGDKVSGGDGLVNSTATTKHDTDDKFYLVDGQMTTTKPAPTFPTPGGGTQVADTGHYIDGDKIGDSSDWLEIATCGEYSLIIRKSPLSGTVYYENALSKPVGWYQNTFSPTSPLRPFISKNDAGWRNGDINSLTKGLSKPTGALAGINDSTTCFLLSYGEFAQYCSKTVQTDKLNNSSTAAKNNANRITTEAQWSSTYVQTTMAGYGYMSAGAVNGKLNDSPCSVHPAMWILTSAFNTLGK